MNSDLSFTSEKNSNIRPERVDKISQKKGGQINILRLKIIRSPTRKIVSLKKIKPLKISVSKVLNLNIVCTGPPKESKKTFSHSYLFFPF